MTIWDEGTYDLLKDSPAEYKVHFHGKRLDGEWVLVQTKQNEGRDWLMIKHGTPPKDHPLDAKIQPMLAITALAALPHLSLDAVTVTVRFSYAGMSSECLDVS